MITGQLTLKPVDLPAVCNAVYLLDDADLGNEGATATYEASLDGGNNWGPLTPGQLVGVGHTGAQLRVRVTMTLPEEAENPAEIYWFLAYATAN